MEQSFSEWKVAAIPWLGKGGGMQKLWPAKNPTSCQAAGDGSNPSGVAWIDGAVNHGQKHYGHLKALLCPSGEWAGWLYKAGSPRLWA